MNHNEWLALKVGDEIIDHAAKGEPRRTVHWVRHVEVRRGGPRHVRVLVGVDGIKRRGSVVTIFEADDWHNGAGNRFSFATLRRCEWRSPGGSTDEGQLPRKGTQCGLPAGHSEDFHTVLIPSGMPWFPRSV